jgi:hypothetical protein
MNYAHIVNGFVENIVVADNEWVSQQEDLYVELTNVIVADIGQEYKDGQFLPMQPNPSWTRNSDNSWSPPVPYPSDDHSLYEWNEETISWVQIQGLES